MKQHVPTRPRPIRRHQPAMSSRPTYYTRFSPPTLSHADIYTHAHTHALPVHVHIPLFLPSSFSRGGVSLSLSCVETDGRLPHWGQGLREHAHRDTETDGWTNARGLLSLRFFSREARGNERTNAGEWPSERLSGRTAGFASCPQSRSIGGWVGRCCLLCG